MSDLRAILRYTRVSAVVGSVVAGIRDSCPGYAGFRPWLLAARPPRPANANSRVDRRSTRDFALYRGSGRAAWALSWPESGIAVPAALVSLVACRGAAAQTQNDAPPRQGNAKTRVDRRCTRVFVF